MTNARTRSAGRLGRVAARTVLLGSLVATSWWLAGPASASEPQTWPTPDPVRPIHAVLLLAGIPILLFVVIAGFVYLPAIIRGERVAPGHAPVEDQWLGGPRRSAGELAAPDTETSDSGGARARW